MTEYLFVYGTLRRNARRRGVGHSASHCRHQLLQQYASLVGQGRLQAKLYLVDYYPGAVTSDNPDWQVSGEVYQLQQPELVLAELDQYEECGPGVAIPTEYLRLKQHVTLQNGEIVIAWVYVYNHPTQGLQQILSGDFILACT